MGGISFSAQQLPDLLSETAGYKAGLTLSVEQMCDLFSGTEYADMIQQAEKHGIRLRSEDCEELFYALYHCIGHTEERYQGFGVESARLFHKYKGDPIALKLFTDVSNLFIKRWETLLEDAHANGLTSLDPEPLLREAKKKFGTAGLKIMLERIEIMERAQRLSPHSMPRYIESSSILTLDGLFDGSAPAPEFGTYIDQRYINFLYKNPNKLTSMHWRKFEELTSEFFYREGYQVELGPGSDDDGVDVRIWNAKDVTSNPPLCIVQCKRTKEKVDKLVIKGLHADVEYFNAKQGLIVTTSELTPGARATITTRGYPIEEVNKTGVYEWLKKLRVCGTGIVRV